MKPRIFLVTLLSCSFLPGIHGQVVEPDSKGAAPDPASAIASAVTPKQSRLTQLSQAYGFLIGQQASLDSISDKYPELASEARQAWFAFNTSAVGESGKSMEAELTKQMGDKWTEVKVKMTTQLQQMVESQPVTKEKAAAFLAEVKARGKGVMPETIRSTLLSTNPRFMDNPELEIPEGWSQTFRTKDHPKAQGADFSISLPASWSKREGHRPDVIQTFRSGAGHGPAMCVLMAKELPIPAGIKFTSEELKELMKEFFTTEGLKKWLAGDGAVIEAQPLFIEGAPAGMVVQDQTGQRLDVVLTTRLTQFVILQGKSLIAIQFPLTQLPGKPETLDDLQKKYLPAYRSIVNTFVNNEKYK